MATDHAWAIRSARLASVGGLFVGCHHPLFRLREIGVMGILAGIGALVEILKKAGILRDRQQEADIQAQFLSSTSGPIYGIARVTVVYASLWDIFFNQARAWATTGLPTLLEYLPIAWLFIGPAIVPFAEAMLKRGLVQPKPPSVSNGQPASVDNTENQNESYTSRTGFRKEP